MDKCARLMLIALATPLAVSLAGCSAKDPVTQTPDYHAGTPTNRSSVNSWELNAEPANTQPGRAGGKPIALAPVASQRGWEPDDPAARDVLAALHADGQVPTAYLSARARAGTVILIGSVPTQALKLRAEQVARRTPGVKHLDSQIFVIPPG